MVNCHKIEFCNLTFYSYLYPIYKTDWLNVMGFTIYTTTISLAETLSVGVSRAFVGVPADRICGVVVYGTDHSAEYHHLLGEIKCAVRGALNRPLPVTLVPQPILPADGFTLDIYTLDSNATFRIEELGGICYGVIEEGEDKMLFVEGVVSSDFGASVEQQSCEVFGRLESLLSRYGFAVDDIVRQWNYIGNIVAYRCGKQNYQEFNDARTAYYSKGAWRNGYPAATGIGASFEGIIVGCITFKSGRAGAVCPIDNPLQVAAHVYSKSVLIDHRADATKSTPKFERAKLIECGHGACCFVSGTAAIRGEQSLEAESVVEQTIKTIENIEYLVSAENLLRSGCRSCKLQYAKLHVFIKHAEDYEQVREVVERAYPQVAVTYTVADVCRGELLVEIEGILIS